MKIENRVQAVREQRGIAAAELARQVAISRPTIYAIEAGTYTPNTAVALRLADVLECGVEDLFSLDSEDKARERALKVKLLSTGAVPEQGEAVQLCHVGKAIVAVPPAARDCYLPDADGIVSRVERAKSEAVVRVMNDLNPGKRILIAGCDPATPILAAPVGRLGFDVIAVACPSRCALKRLKAGLVHIAGCHLKDPQTGEYNLPFVSRLFKEDEVRVVSYVTWEQGLVVRTGNPKGIRKIEDLDRKNIRIINREKGSGARELLDRGLDEAGILPRRLLGYDDVAHGHIPAALAVSRSHADCCIATRSAARHFGLGFVPLASERYDFVVLRRYWSLPAVRAFFDELSGSRFRRKLESITSYDAARAGELREKR